jgi:hypothetical protein
MAQIHLHAQCSSDAGNLGGQRAARGAFCSGDTTSHHQLSVCARARRVCVCACVCVCVCVCYHRKSAQAASTPKKYSISTVSEDNHTRRTHSSPNTDRTHTIPEIHTHTHTRTHTRNTTTHNTQQTQHTQHTTHINTHKTHKTHTTHTTHTTHIQHTQHTHNTHNTHTRTCTHNPHTIRHQHSPSSHPHETWKGRTNIFYTTPSSHSVPITTG